MQSRDEIFKWVVDLLKREFQFRDEELVPTAHLIDDLDIDSIDAVDLGVRVEEQMRIHLDEDDLKSLKILQDVVDLIHERL